MLIKKLLRFLLSFVLIICVLSLTVLGGYGYFLYSKITKEEPVEQKIIAIRSQQNYTVYQDISPDFLNAIYSVEDKRFYKHGAIDTIGIARAVISNVRSRKFKEGGSTITQQLAKNMYFGHERSLSRKLTEFYLAHKLEKLLSKNEILELYVNIVYFGDGHYGITDAAKGYFKKKPSELTLDEATLLAGLPNAPSILALSRNMEGARNRQKDVLEAMLSTKTITEEQLKTIIKNNK